MAVLIPKMQMPVNCKMCPLTDWGCDPPLCVAVPRCRPVDMWEDKRVSWCPLVEVKERRRDPEMDKLMEEAGLE